MWSYEKEDRLDCRRGGAAACGMCVPGREPFAGRVARAAHATATPAPTPAPAAPNMVANGDFSSGADNWHLYLANGGAATISNRDGVGVVNITSCGTTDYAVQLYYDGFKLETGGVYRFSFDAKADIARQISRPAADQRRGLSRVHRKETRYRYGHETLRNRVYDDGRDGPAPRLCFNIGTPAGQSEPPAHSLF